MQCTSFLSSHMQAARRGCSSSNSKLSMLCAGDVIPAPRKRGRQAKPQEHSQDADMQDAEQPAEAAKPAKAAKR